VAARSDRKIAQRDQHVLVVLEPPLGRHQVHFTSACRSSSAWPCASIALRR
jgi:hypothetical protein